MPFLPDTHCPVICTYFNATGKTAFWLIMKSLIFHFLHLVIIWKLKTSYEYLKGPHGWKSEGVKLRLWAGCSITSQFGFWMVDCDACLVGIATTLQVGLSRAQIPEGARASSLLQNVQTSSGTLPASCSMGTRFLSWGKRDQGLRLTTHLHLEWI